ncbi:MAG: outer membrane protein transport protein [Wenzhouxiangellaceae bacterium]|nr:outer membrane protein transport protein [Wenzhouxiangellaceae bacterium]
MTRPHRLIAAVALAVSLAGPAAATNGYFAHGYGTIAKGMAGAGTAWSQDALAAATNPAGMAFIGDRMDFGVELFSPRRAFTVTGGGPPQPGQFLLRPGRRNSGSEYFAIPHFGINRTIGTTHSLGVSVYANGGMNTDFGADFEAGDFSTFFDGEAGVDMAQLFVAPTWAWRYRPDQAIGVSVLLAAQRFKVKGIGTFAPFSSDPQRLSNNGYDTSLGWGFQLGWQGQVTETLRAGLSWRNVVYMQKFDKYRGLFAEQGDFDIPQMFNAGIAWSGLGNHTLLLDVQHVRYSKINSVGNPLLPNLFNARLGDDDGAGFGWDDVTAVKLGWQWQQSLKQAWRAGFSHSGQPIDESEVLFNILAPGVQEWHVSAGFTRTLSDRLALSGMAFYSPEKKVKGPNPLGPGQQIELQMHQFGASLSLGWTF